MALRSRSFLIVAFLIVAAICGRLGVWQVERLKARRAANNVSLEARASPAVTLEAGNLDTSVINRHVVATGRYDHDHDIVLRGREYRGVPGVELVSPLRLQLGDTVVLVNRGFVPSPDAVTADPTSVREPGTVRVEGIALPFSPSGGAPLQRGDRITWARLEKPSIAARLPYPVAPFYILQTPDSSLPRIPRRLDPPALDDGPHLSYAIQWFSFAIIALVFAGIVVKRRL